MAKGEGKPGAVRLGNFINYYQFHPPEDRVKHLPENIFQKENDDSKFVCLDIGCNTGDLTQEVYKYVSKSVHNSNSEFTNQNNCFILGIDIDSSLISRAKECNEYKNHITYQTLDIMTDKSVTALQEYLQTHGANQFNAIFCFSVTMWIHLNHGDNGLKQFLSNLCKMTEILVIESQPWKCYLSAVRRLKRSNESFPNINDLKMNKRVDCNIEDIIQNKHKFQKIYESSPNSWGRRIVFFRKTIQLPKSSV